MKPARLLPILSLLSLSLLACNGTTAQPNSPVSAGDPAVVRGAEPNVVEVIARGMEFVAPDEIPSGWTTLRLKNESSMVHFAAIQRLPEGVTRADQQAAVAPVFQAGMDLLNAQRYDEALQKFGELPTWFGEVVFFGGPGLIAAHETAETTVYLEPGTYLLECYIKTGGRFHSYNPAPGGVAMVHQISVTDDEVRAPVPKPTFQVTISAENGIETTGRIRPGKQIVAVHFEDQQAHEHFLGHDVHLVRLEEDTDLDALAAWMDWTQPSGLETPAPATFLGGTQEMPAGETAYVSVVLTPGRYAWIAEVPDPVGKGMFEPFNVPGETSSRR